MPNVQLFVNGQIYGGWQRVTVNRSLEAISGKFDLQVMDRWKEDAQPWTIRPGDKCELKIDGTAVVSGYVDSASPSYDDSSHGIDISGRDRTGDLVDCSAIVKGSELRKQKLEGIVAAIAKPFGVTVKTEVDTGAVFETFAIQPGETAWEAIERAARQRFMVITVDGNGNLVISDIGTRYAADDLIEGVNIKSAQASYDFSNRFSEYTVKGQQAAQNDGAQPGKTDVQSKAVDKSITRYRPKILTAETQASDGSAQNRAQLEAATRAGKSTKITVKVQGWTMGDGELWPVNVLININSRMLSINEDLLISAVRFVLSDSDGFVTELELTRPEAFLKGQGKGKKGRKAKKKKAKASDTDTGTEPWELAGYD